MRRASWVPPQPRFDYGWLARYHRMVTPASHGAVLEVGMPRRAVQAAD